PTFRRTIPPTCGWPGGSRTRSSSRPRAGTCSSVRIPSGAWTRYGPRSRAASSSRCAGGRVEPTPGRARRHGSAARPGKGARGRPRPRRARPVRRPLRKREARGRRAARPGPADPDRRRARGRDRPRRDDQLRPLRRTRAFRGRSRRGRAGQSFPQLAHARGGPARPARGEVMLDFVRRSLRLKVIVLVVGITLATLLLTGTLLILYDLRTQRQNWIND